MTGQNLSHLALSDNGFLFDSATGHTYTLNTSGTFILKKLIEGLSFEQVKAVMIATFDTSEAVQSKDLDQFLHFLSEQGLIQKS